MAVLAESIDKLNRFITNTRRLDFGFCAELAEYLESLDTYKYKLTKTQFDNLIKILIAKKHSSLISSCYDCDFCDRLNIIKYVFKNNIPTESQIKKIMQCYGNEKINNIDGSWKFYWITVLIDEQNYIPSAQLLDALKIIQYSHIKIIFCTKNITDTTADDILSSIILPSCGWHGKGGFGGTPEIFSRKIMKQSKRKEKNIENTNDASELQQRYRVYIDNLCKNLDIFLEKNKITFKNLKKINMNNCYKYYCTEKLLNVLIKHLEKYDGELLVLLDNYPEIYERIKNSPKLIKYTPEMFTKLIKNRTDSNVIDKINKTLSINYHTLEYLNIFTSVPSCHSIYKQYIMNILDKKIKPDNNTLMNVCKNSNDDMIELIFKECDNPTIDCLVTYCENNTINERILSMFYTWKILPNNNCLRGLFNHLGYFPNCNKFILLLVKYGLFVGYEEIKTLVEMFSHGWKIPITLITESTVLIDDKIYHLCHKYMCENALLNNFNIPSEILTLRQLFYHTGDNYTTQIKNSKSDISDLYKNLYGNISINEMKTIYKYIKENLVEPDKYCLDNLLLCCKNKQIITDFMTKYPKLLPNFVTISRIEDYTHRMFIVDVLDDIMFDKKYIHNY